MQAQIIQTETGLRFILDMEPGIHLPTKAELIQLIAKETNTAIKEQLVPIIKDAVEDALVYTVPQAAKLMAIQTNATVRAHGERHRKDPLHLPIMPGETKLAERVRHKELIKRIDRLSKPEAQQEINNYLAKVA